MSLRDDIKEVQKETENLEQEVYKGSFAMEILHDQKVENKTIKILLGISILVNIIIVLLLK
jgi:hypothetical protein